MAEEKFKIIQVTFTKDYYIPMHDDTKTKVNGWTIKEVIEDWFKRCGCPWVHASRDSHEIGNSMKYVSYKIKEID